MADEGLRERKKRETRLALSHATIQLALANGLEAVTVSEIAAAVDVSERTFRNYFGSKAEAVVAAHVERGWRIAEAVLARPAGEPLWDAVTHAVVAQFEPSGEPTGDGRPEGLQRLLAEPSVQHEVFRAHAQAQDRLTAAIAERTGTAAEDLYPRTVAAVVSAGLGVAMAQWTQDPARSLVSLLREVFDGIRAGLPDPR
ncbi:TetR family transcriptional regulator [Actinokineospora auranticolor]|uniref:AcrR family transcriptional regulator n=1 Tax=Actinokineospora auranticolor TaxID=155976 RepID=A0A2S6GN56_9PSEU|nr:TetR family transcriptional regulator [Actinokineospora auranticolor]PPK66658.1 AcrR family transcriptional regulator [Actinokineospora auranticolor]